MMKRFPTWHVWQWLHTYPPQHTFESFLRITQVKPRVHIMRYLTYASFWITATLILTFWLGQIGYWLMPLFTTILSLRYALQITQVITQQRKNKTFDLLSLYVGGEQTGVQLARARRYPQKGTLDDFLPIFIFVTMISCCGWMMPPTIGAPLDVIIISMIVVGALRFVDYLQSFVAAALIALFVSQQEDSDSNMRLMAWFLCLQIVCYGSVWLLFNLLFPTKIPAASESYQGFKIAYILNFIIPPMVSIMLRELVNFVLWRVVKRRLEA